ncbi:MAG: transaldolase [Verrucomicrobia bacterium]|nr:transaldolase [Verrucomicrobiota bacterium]MDA1086663.1 transaldolase [Verrucomicrobiota bacterium]
MTTVQSDTVADRIHAYLTDELDRRFEEVPFDAQPDVAWQRMREAGTQLWLDTGDMDEAAKLWNSEFSALTTNNSLLNNEVQKGIYDDIVNGAANVIREADPDIDSRALLLELAFILNACHAMRLVERFNVNVSVELHTDLAHDAERSVAYGQRYFALCPEKFIIKIPLTPAGFIAARRLGQLSIPVNFTLNFSARQDYFAARFSNPTYVNVFLGRLNAFVKDHGLGDGENVGEKTVLSTQRELIALRESGDSQTKLIGASIRSGDQVVDIAGVDVQTIPTKAATQFRDSASEDAIPSKILLDPEIVLSDGVSVQDFNGATLWDVPDDFKACVDDLMNQNMDQLDATQLQEHFHAAGQGDFMPKWTPAEVATIASDGKIPIYETWKERLSSGDLGLDALINLSGLQAFTKDQKALDDRVALHI